MSAIDRENVIDLDRVVAAVRPAIGLYRSFAAWAAARLDASLSAPG